MDFKLYQCAQCGFEYDEELGWPEDGIEPGTRWDDIPDDWSCPTAVPPRVTSTWSRWPAREHRRVVIVGSGIAGITAAESLRAAGFTGPVTVIGEEPALPYRRTALSRTCWPRTCPTTRSACASPSSGPSVTSRSSPTA